MRLPFTSGELSTIRSGARIAVQWGGIITILAVLYFFTGWFERILTGKKEVPVHNLVDHLLPWVSEVTSEEQPLLLKQPPYFTKLASADGRTVEAVVLRRVGSERVTFRRVSDSRTFTIQLDQLDSASQKLVRSFPDPSLSIHRDPILNDLIEEALPLLPRVSHKEFPFNTQLTSKDGRTLQATLLERPQSEQITFRRRRDQVVFTLPLDRLAPSDQELIEQFPVLPR
ncbi:MAG: hypothetical protein AAGA96_06975 [Verrucomicrobiota bacterium]